MPTPRGWAHGNIKPANIVISADLGAILTGFGPALAIQALSLHTNVSFIQKAAYYIAPEIWQGKPPTAQSDQYSLACVLAEILSGEKPFEAPTIAEIKEKHLAQFETPLSWAVLIPWPTAKAIRRALDRDPAKRYKSIEVFATAPEKLSDEVVEDTQLKDELAKQAQAWQEAQQIAKKEAEEAARLAALEKARQEMEEELQRQALSQSPELPVEEPAPAVSAPVAASPNRNRRRSSRSPARRRGTLWISLTAILLTLAGIWLALWLSNQNASSIIPATMTPTQAQSTLPALAATPVSPASSTPTAATTASPTASLTSTMTVTSTATKTSTPTITRTATNTSIATLTATLTRTPKDKDTSPKNTPEPRPNIP